MCAKGLVMNYWRSSFGKAILPSIPKLGEALPNILLSQKEKYQVGEAQHMLPKVTCLCFSTLQKSEYKIRFLRALAKKFLTKTKNVTWEELALTGKMWSLHFFLSQIKKTCTQLYSNRLRKMILIPLLFWNWFLKNLV